MNQPLSSPLPPDPDHVLSAAATPLPKYTAQVVAAFQQLTSASVANSCNSIWTKAVKQAIAKLGKDNHFKVCTSGFAEDYDREWLYDLVWYKNNANSRLECIPLVLESEWEMNPFQIRYDFEKLLLANAPIKVMVFQDRDGTFDQTLENLLAGIMDYRNETLPCVYIFACYRWSKGCFDVRVFRHSSGGLHAEELSTGRTVLNDQTPMRA